MNSKKAVSVFLIILFSLIITISLILVSLEISGLTANYYTVSAEDDVTEWKFASDKSGAIYTSSSNIWKYSNASANIRKPLLDKYLLLIAVLPSQDEASTLFINYNGENMTAEIGGVSQEVKYILNPLTLRKTAMIDLPASNNEREITVKIKSGLILGFRSGLTTSDRITYIDLIKNNLKFPLIATLAFLGLLIFFISLILAVQLKNVGRIVWAGLFALGTSIAIFLSEHVDFILIKSKILDTFFGKSEYPKELILLLSILLLIIFGTYIKSVAKRNTLSIVLLSILGLLTIAQVISMPNNLYVFLMFFFSALAVFIGVLFVIYSRGMREPKKLSENFLDFVFLLSIMCVVYDIQNPILKLFSGEGGIYYTPFVLYFITLIYISINRAINVNIRVNERNDQIARNSMWIKRIFEESANIFAKREFDKFCIQTALSFKKLIFEDKAEDFRNSAKNKDEVFAEPSICVAVKDKDDKYKEIFNRGNIVNCDYDIIESKYLTKQNGGIYFGGSYIAMQLFTNNLPGAIIYIEGIENGISDNLRNILNIAYSNIAIALDNLKLKEDIMQTRESVFTYLSEMSEAKSEETGMHIKRVAEYVRAICQELGMSPEESKIVSIGSMMHDIGKLAIPEELITKSGKLTDEEYEIVKRHIYYGHNMLSKSEGEYMKAGAIIAQQHHEKWNGEGYLGLKGEQIHKYARITAIADVFDALMSNRSYKTSWTIEEACGYILEKAGTQFDPHIARVFVSNVGKIREIINQFPD